MKKDEVKTEQKKISYGRLIYEALPEMWGFQLLVAIISGVPMFFLSGPVASLATVDGVAVTTANMKGFLLSWRFPVLLVIGIAIVLYFIVVELFAQIYLCDDILQGKKSSIWRELARGFKGLRRFLSPMGIFVILYVFIAVPLCGLGFSISLTEQFHIPNFIMDVVWAKPLYAVGYVAGIIALLWFGFHGIFTLHAVLIDKMTPSEGRRKSVELIKQNRWKFIIGMIKTFIICALIQFAVYAIFNIGMDRVGGDWGNGLPKNYDIDIIELAQSDTPPDEQVFDILTYRVISAFTIIIGEYLNAIVVLLTGTYIML